MLSENVEIIVGDGAQLTVVTVQEWNDDAVHLASHFSRIGHDAKFKHIVVSLGGSIVRLNPSTHLVRAGGDVETVRRLLRRCRASTSSSRSSCTTTHRTPAPASTTRARCRARVRAPSGSATC